jgi:hypothetical protein
MSVHSFRTPSTRFQTTPGLAGTIMGFSTLVVGADRPISRIQSGDPRVTSAAGRFKMVTWVGHAHEAARRPFPIDEQPVQSADG